MTDRLVWYAAYGSNLNPDRFVCYIEGGKPKFSRKEMLGCRDKTHPRGTKTFLDKYDLYFAKRSSLWNGGVCFIEEGDSKTLFDLYLISAEQFKEVLLQECGFNSMDDKIDLVLNEQDHLFDDRSWYGRVLYLGELEGHSIYTMTAPEDYSDELLNPSRYYLYHIIKGLHEVHDLTKEEIDRYVTEKKGFDDKSELEEAVKIYKNENQNFY